MKALLTMLAVATMTWLSPVRPAFAHRPIFTEDAAKSPETAIHMAAPDLSQVVYREITEKTPQVWLTFTLHKDFALFIQIGMPKIERQRDFRPAMVLTCLHNPPPGSKLKTPRTMVVLSTPIQRPNLLDNNTPNQRLHAKRRSRPG